MSLRVFRDADPNYRTLTLMLMSKVNTKLSIFFRSIMEVNQINVQDVKTKVFEIVRPCEFVMIMFSHTSFIIIS